LKIYLAGPMRGLPEFNFQAFNTAAKYLRWYGHIVFNPAERDAAVGFDPTGMSGSNEDLEKAQFSVREAFAADTAWICEHAEAVYLLPGWRESTGAIAERALGEALGLRIVEYGIGVSNWKIREFLKKSVAPVS
jgi:hypothetical protein